MVLIDDPDEWRRTRGLTLPPGMPPSVIGVLNQQNLFKKGYVYTGRCPASRPHLGHLIGWETIKQYAKTWGAAIRFMVSDDQAARVKSPGGPSYLGQNLDAIRTFFGDVADFDLILNSETEPNMDLLYDACGLFRHTGQWEALFGIDRGRASLQMVLYGLVQTAFSLKLSRERTTTVFAGADQYPFFAKLKGVPGVAVVLLNAVPDLMFSEKMSGSAPKGCIFLKDSPSQIDHKVRSARTDAGSLQEHRSRGVGPKDSLLTLFRMRGLPCSQYAQGRVDVVTFKQWAAEEIKYLLEPFNR